MVADVAPVTEQVIEATPSVAKTSSFKIRIILKSKQAKQFNKEPDLAVKESEDQDKFGFMEEANREGI